MRLGSGRVCGSVNVPKTFFIRITVQFGPLIIGTRSMTHQTSFRNWDYAYILLAPLQEVDGSRDKDIRLVSPTQREPTRMPHNQELFWDVHQATDMYV